MRLLVVAAVGTGSGGHCDKSVTSDPSTAVLVEKPVSDSLQYSHCYHLHYY